MGEQLRGKVALVTGAGAGIGRASALVFAREGARVVVSDVNVEGGEETARRMRDAGGDARFVRADVSNEAHVRELIATTIDAFGRLDIAFNNAGIEGTLATTHECSEASWDRTLAVNLKGVWLCMRAEIEHMLRQGGGAIVNMSSVAGLVGFSGLPAYVASKHAVLGLTKTAALEYAERGIRINAVCPGVIHTEMIDRVTGKTKEAEQQFIAYEPIGRMGRPEEVAEAAVWLASDAASFVTGVCLPIDGGFVAR